MARKILIALVVLLALLVLAVVVFVATFDANRFKPRIEEYVAFDVAGTFTLRATQRRAWYSPDVRARFALPRGQQRLLQQLVG